MLEVIVLHTCWQKPWLHFFFFFFEGGQIFWHIFLFLQSLGGTERLTVFESGSNNVITDVTAACQLSSQCKVQPVGFGVRGGRGVTLISQNSKELIYLLQLNWVESYRISSAGSQACGVFFRAFFLQSVMLTGERPLTVFSMREQTVMAGFQLKETLWCQWNSHSDKRTARKGRM